MHPLVSVVTPALNPGRRLERCIASVQAQTYPNIEHVVVDGGSRDGTVELLERTSGIEWISEADSGQAAAINKGFRMARGTVLGWLNADDTLTPDAVRLVTEAFSQDPEIGWVYGDVEIVDGDNREIARPAPLDKPLRWAARNLAAQPGSFHTRAALERVGYLDESFNYMMDCDLWLRLIDAGVGTRYIPTTLATFEVHGESKTGSVSNAEFVREEALARLKSGRVRSAAVAFGRAAAWVAFRDGHHDEMLLQEELVRVAQLLRDREVTVPSELILAGAKTERAILEAKSQPLRGLRHLLNARVWTYPETRARVRDAAVREVNRRARQDRATSGTS